MAPLVGDGNEIEYRFWDALHSWEFILNCLSIARATKTFPLIGQKLSWKQTVEQLRAWVDSLINYPEFKDLIYSGTHFFWDMLQFFVDNRQLVDPERLSKEVLGVRRSDGLGTGFPLS